MRITLDIADDVLLAAKEIARREERSLGDVVSELARRAIAQALAERLARQGIRPFPSRGGFVTNEMIDRICDEEGI